MAEKTLTILTFLALILTLGLGAYTSYSLYRLRKLRHFFSEENQPENLEEILNSVAKKLKLLDKRTTTQKEYSEKLEKRLGFAVQKTAVVKFNSFSDQGGNLSFVLALLDKDDNGFVITNLHGREQNRIYTKVISAGVSDTALITEEQEAVNRAIAIWKKQTQEPKRATKL